MVPKQQRQGSHGKDQDAARDRLILQQGEQDRCPSFLCMRVLGRISFCTMLKTDFQGPTGRLHQLQIECLVIAGHTLIPESVWNATRNERHARTSFTQLRLRLFLIETFILCAVASPGMRFFANPLQIWRVFAGNGDILLKIWSPAFDLGDLLCCFPLKMDDVASEFSFSSSRGWSFQFGGRIFLLRMVFPVCGANTSFS